MVERKQTYAEVVAERDSYKHELDVIKQDRVNRQAKNSVFLNLFMRKEYQLQLYKEFVHAGYHHYGRESGISHIG